jgi:hypothetical protein
MTTKRLQFTDWLPDQPANAGSLNDAKNVYPLGIGYGAFPSSVDFSNSASETLNSVFVAKFGANVEVFAGSATKIYKLNISTLALADVSKSGGYSGTGIWRFEQFGNVVLACNDNARIQAWTIGSSTAFADVSATAPIAKDIAIVRDFVFAVNLNIGTNPDKVQWSDINDETDWVSGATSQSDFQIIADGGNVQAITGGEFGVVLLEKSVVRCSYVGSPLFWQFDTISSGLGCLEGHSVARYGNITFFLSDDGWYSTDGQTVTNIGLEKIDRWFFSRVDLTQLNTMSAAVDPVKNLVVWNYADVDGNRRILIYNWQLQKWSRAETTSDSVGTIATLGESLESLGSALGYTDIDTMPASLDSRLFIGGKFLFAGTKDDKIVTFTGTSITPQLITTDVEIGYNSVATLARPQIDNGTAQVAVASRRELDDTIGFSAFVPATSEGRCNLRSAGRYHRFNVQPTGNWTTAMAVDVDVKPQGNR